MGPLQALATIPAEQAFRPLKRRRLPFREGLIAADADRAGLPGPLALDGGPRKAAGKVVPGRKGDPMEFGIRGLRVLVTAGASGIGLEIARSFIREGARVHICESITRRSPPWRRATLVSRAPAPTLQHDHDVSRLFDEALHALGGLDVLVNNAGIAGPTARVDEVDPEDWDRTLQVNITGQFNCARLAVQHLRAAKTPPLSISRPLQDVLAFLCARPIRRRNGP